MQLYIRHEAEWESVADGTHMLHIAGYVGMVVEPKDGGDTRWTVTGPNGLAMTTTGEGMSVPAAKNSTQAIIADHVDRMSRS